MKLFFKPDFEPRNQGMVLPLVIVSVVVMTSIMMTLIVGVMSVRRGQLSHADKVFRGVDSLIVSDAIRETLYDYTEISSLTSSETFSDNLDARLDAMSVPEVTFSVSSLDAVFTSPPNSKTQLFPFGTLTMAGAGFSKSAATVEDRRAFNLLENGMRYASLLSGDVTVNLDYSDNLKSDFSFTYEAEVIAMPLSNYGILGYGMPSTGSVPSSPPSSLQSSGVIQACRLAGGAVKMLNLKTMSTSDNTFPDVYAGDGSLPYYYRSDVALLWNSFEYLMGYEHQGDLVNQAQFYGTLFDFGNSTVVPAGMVYDGATSTLTVDLSAFSEASPIVILDYIGGGNVVVQGGDASDLPVNLMIRNYTSPFNRTDIALETPRRMVFWGSGCRIVSSMATASGSFNTAMLLLDHRSYIDCAFSLEGTLAFNLASEPISSGQLAGFSVRPFSAANLQAFDRYAPFATIALVERK